MTESRATLPDTGPLPQVAAPPTAASALRRRWLDSAFENAGIDPSHWDPSRGVETNRRTIERVYDYYGRLYLRHAHLEWAGMANLIGPSFYAGFLDIGLLPDQTRRLLEDVRRAPASARLRIARLLRRDAALEQALVGDLGFFETTFLTMQRKIFEDQALMHEAYLGGGCEAIRALGSAGIIDSGTAGAWEQIDSGDIAQVHEGNRTLLYREQHDIVDRFYVDMRNHAPPAGQAFTYLFTLAGAPAVPGAKSYTAAFPLTLAVALSPRLEFALRTPLAAGNLALFSNRWKLIAEDTLPAYQRLIAENVADARALIELPISQRAGRFRLVRSGGRLVLGLLTQWRLGVQPAAVPPQALPARVDLTTPPTRAALGLAEGSDTRVWATGRNSPFAVTVQLPEARTFATNAVLAVLLSPEPGGNPTRFTVKLPATDLDGARQTLARLSRDWNLDQADIAGWAARAADVTLSSHAYSTRVFRAEPIGFVRLEVQVEHHIEQDGYVVDVLFSWERSHR